MFYGRFYFIYATTQRHLNTPLGQNNITKSLLKNDIVILVTILNVSH